MAKFEILLLLHVFVAKNYIREPADTSSAAAIGCRKSSEALTFSQKVHNLNQCRVKKNSLFL